ncbi:winged helix-turn-helix domain-containing protein [Pseudooceanicola sp. CBS1P-1]|uniref:Response regulator n=1 Tax=Pseudooceanicola albus TaxID=2692189 RepID=A0A6L7FYQ7_9RHOB|nr:MULTISPECIES: response regulator transcription factor [Pseudooceanicola]MBT9383421.1 winged helix-turn-helix domain-containing protein [Pseudooceanicola endophyticus]MXN16257.1 response regulator [Pseudooceanicola albus]
MRILIVEDDAVLADGLLVGLRLCGFTPDHVGDLADARAALATAEFEAMILDVMLPDGLGLDLLREMRAAQSTLPVLLLTARDRVRDRVEGLDLGADDYLGKPFDLEELAARLRAMLRRRGGRGTAGLSWNGLSVDPATLSGQQDGRAVSFSRREFAVLQALLEHPGHILSRGTLEDRLYGWQDEIESNAVEVHVHNLRAKLGRGFIETVRGLGYRVAQGEGAPSRSG